MWPGKTREILQRQGPEPWTVPRAEVGVFEKKDLLMVSGGNTNSLGYRRRMEEHSLEHCSLQGERKEGWGRGDIDSAWGRPDHEVVWRGRSPSRQESQGGRVWRQEPSDGGGGELKALFSGISTLQLEAAA